MGKTSSERKKRLGDAFVESRAFWNELRDSLLASRSVARCVPTMAETRQEVAGEVARIVSTHAERHRDVVPTRVLEGTPHVAEPSLAAG